MDPDLDVDEVSIGSAGPAGGCVGGPAAREARQDGRAFPRSGSGGHAAPLSVGRRLLSLQRQCYRPPVHPVADTPWSLAVGLSILLGACDGPPAADGQSGRATLVIDDAWSVRPWADSAGAAAKPARMRANFELPADRAGSNAELVLDGMRWSAVLTVNGHELAPVTGGPGPARVPLGGALRAGSNALTLTIEGPRGVDALLTGSRHDSVALSGPPRLEFLPAADRIEQLAGRLDEAGATAVIEATGGVRVDVVATLDGRVLQQLGTASLEAGQAQTSPVGWQGERWPEGDQDLVFLWATLRDAAGRILDQRGLRTGFRTVALEGADLEINGASVHLLASRKWERSLGRTLWDGFQSGGNALELHGLPPAEAWMARTDELGVYVVDMPRCDGHVHATAARVAALATELAAQDRAVVRAMAGHPSLVLWSMEGQTRVFEPMLERLRADPVSRITAGLDLPSVALSPTTPLVPDAQPWWNNEVNMGGRQRPTGEVAAARMGEIFAAGAIGTHIPNWGGGQGDRRSGQLAWQTTARDAGVDAPASSRRAAARVEVTGLRPGQTAWATAPRHPVVGAIAGSDGTAALELWHEGTATIDVDGRQRTVEVHPGRWQRQDPGSPQVGGRDPLASAWKGVVSRVAWDALPGE